MGGGSGSGRHGGQGGQGGRGGDLMTEQMHTLLEMLRAAKADDMMALEEAKSRALQNKETMRRAEKERERRKDQRGNNSGGRPALEASESVEIARAEKEAARRQQKFEARQREYERQQQQQQDQQHEGGVYPEEWEEDSRDMTRMGDSTDLTRATYEMARTADLEEAAAMAQAQAQAQAQADANRSGKSNESDRSGRHRRLAEDMAALQLDGGNGGGYGHDDQVDEEVAPLKPPAPSRYSSPDGSGRSRRRSDEGRAEDLERRAQQRQKNRAHNKRRSYHGEPLETPTTSAHGDGLGGGGGESRAGGSKTTASDDWGERQAEAYTMHHAHGNEDDNVNPDEPMEEEMEEEDGEELSHHTREEMGPPISLEDEEAYYHQALAKERAAEQHKYDARREERREQSSSNVDADIQSRVLRQLENDEGAGGDYYNDDDGDDNYDEEDDDYYDSDESSEISDITSPTFATYMDPPTVCDDGSIISRGVRYAAGSRFAGMTAAQVAALANRRVNDRHRADGRSVTSEDENAQELERRLDTSGTGVGGGAGAGAGSMDPAAAGGEADKQRRQMARDEEQEPSLAPPSLAPPSMAGIGNHGSGHIRPPSLRELQRQQQELVAAQQAAAAAEEEAKQEHARLEQQQKDEEEKAQVEAAIAAAERQRAEDERLEAEKRRKAEEEEEALRRADQEARDKARARQKERRERQRREIAERQEKQRRLEEERMQKQMQQAIDEQDMQQEATEEADKDDAIPPPVTTQRSTSPTPPQGRKERPAIKSARPARPPSSQDPTRRSSQRPGALPGSGAQPPPRRPPARRPGQPGPPGARPGPPGPGQPMQRPDRARRQTSVPRDGQQPRGPPTRPGEVRPGAAPGDRNSRPMSSDKPEKNKRRSALGTLLKAKTKFKAAASSAQANSGETSPHASHSSRTARASGGTSTRQRASQRDATRKSLLSPSATPSSPGRRPAGRSSQRDRARPTRGMARAESAAWKQPLREEHMEKKLNPNDDSKNLDVDNLMSNMGQDIDYIFRELSTFEGQQKQKTQGVEGTDLPANLSPKIDESDSSDSDDASLIATAKIKYTLGQLSSTLKQDEKRPRSSSNPDPLLIDEDGFLVAEGAQPTPNDAFGASSFAGQPKDDKNRRSKRSELLAAKRKELQGYQNQQKLRQNSLRKMRGGTNADDERDNQTLATTEVEADVRNRVMSLAAGKANKNDDEGSVGLIRGVPDLDKGERNFSTINYDDDDDISKIDAVEAATKKRIEMLRRVVAEKAVQLSAADKKGGRGSAHHHPEDDELTTKLDYVEQETMKQISRLRKRYKSTRNMET